MAKASLKENGSRHRSAAMSSAGAKPAWRGAVAKLKAISKKIMKAK